MVVKVDRPGRLWPFLALAALGATFVGGPAPITFALVAIIGVGMLHGISDLAVVAPARRGSFLVAFLMVVGLTLLWWRVSPTSALAAFLLASAVHFAIEDVPAGRPLERLCHGLLIVGAPALLHRTDLVGMFEALGLSATAAHLLAELLFGGAVAGLVLLPCAIVERRRNGETQAGRLVVALAALVCLPPLIGFGLAFVAVHAGPELERRVDATGRGRITVYLREHAGIAIGAASVLALSGWLMAGRVDVPLAVLFAGVASLATPHMLITPLWRSASGRTGQSALVAPVVA